MSEQMVVKRGPSHEGLALEVVHHVATYVPKRICDPARWEEIGSSVRELALSMRPGTYGAARMVMWTVTRFLDWLVEEGIDIHPYADSFTIENFNLFAATRPRDQRASMRARLKTLACRQGLVFPAEQPKLRRHQHLAPYTAAEQKALLRRAACMRTPNQQRVSEVVLLLGLGCGLTGTETAAVCREDVSRRDGAVVVSVPGRVVACREEHEDALWAWVKRTDAGATVVGVARLEPVLIAFNKGFEPSLRLVRLRTTWMVSLLGRVPFGVVMKGAGLSSVHPLQDALSHLPPVDEETMLSLLRGGAGQ